MEFLQLKALWNVFKFLVPGQIILSLAEKNIPLIFRYFVKNFPKKILKKGKFYSPKFQKFRTISPGKNRIIGEFWKIILIIFFLLFTGKMPIGPFKYWQEFSREILEISRNFQRKNRKKLPKFGFFLKKTTRVVTLVYQKFFLICSQSCLWI